MGHIYLSTAPKKELFGEYVYYLLVQRGGFQNITQTLQSYITSKLKKKKNIKKEEFINNLNPQDFNYLFDEHLKYKLEQRKQFDTFTLPSVLTQNQFKNRSPLEIYQEKERYSYHLIKDILEKGFPIVAGNSLYVFYIGEIPYDVYQKFYDQKENLRYATEIPLEYKDKKINISVFMLEDRDYFNALLFLYALVGILKEPEIEKVDRIIIWKRKEGGGSFFEITDLRFVLNLLYKKEEKTYETNLAKFIAYLFAIRGELIRKNKNEKIIERLLDEFSYYILIKKMLDSYVINQTVNLTVALYKESWIKILNKQFIVKLMEEVTGYKMDEYFKLGQELRSKIYSLIQEQKGISLERANEKQKREIIEDAEKLIDRLAKDLRNEELPEYFAETFERDIVWLKSRGLKISKELSEKFAKLMYDLKTSDLSRFYLIKASIILGLLSPVQKAEEISEIEAE